MTEKKPKKPKVEKSVKQAVLPQTKQQRQLSERVQRYKNVFLNNKDGQWVLEDLSGLFMDRELFTKDSARQTDFNLGARHVVRFILIQLSKVIGESNDRSN